MKIPFDIKYRPQIESGEYKVVDKDNHNIRIICWDKKSEKKYGYHIVGLVEFGPDHEESTYYTIDGKGRLGDKHPCLFIVTPGPTDMSEFGMKVSEFAEAYELAATDCESEEYKTCNGNLQLIIDKYAAEILALARKELENEAPSIIHVQSFNAGLKHGKAAALKDLPRWKKCADCTPKPKYSNEWIFSIDSENVTRESAIVHKGYFLPLDCLEKLPGFKED